MCIECEVVRDLPGEGRATGGDGQRGVGHTYRVAGRKKDGLRADHTRNQTQENSAREAEYARQAREGACAAEGLCNGICSSLARLTKENAALRWGADLARLEDDGHCRRAVVVPRGVGFGQGAVVRTSEIVRLCGTVAEARLEGNRAVTALEACQGEVAYLQELLDMLS